MKLDKVKPLDLSEVINKRIHNRIHRVGLELEGGWVTLPRGVRLVRDSSVMIPESKPSERERELYNLINANWASPVEAHNKEYEKLYHARINNNPQQQGELPSLPLEIKEWENWIRQSYPSHVNSTCGMHVHMSFRTIMAYQRTMAPEFVKTVLAEFQKWAEVKSLPTEHPLWGRLAGNSEYCQHLFFADDQAKWTRKEYEHHAAKHRYTVVNWCYSRYGTVEVRLLPMMDTIDLAVDAIKHLMLVTNAFLVATAIQKGKSISARKEAALCDDICLTETSVKESVTICV